LKAVLPPQIADHPSSIRATLLVLAVAAALVHGCSGLPSTGTVSEGATVVFAAFEGEDTDAPTISSIATVVIAGIRATFDGPAETELIMTGIPYGEETPPRQPMTVTAPGYETVSQQLTLSQSSATFVDLSMAKVDLTQTGTVEGIVASTTSEPITSAVVTFSWTKEDNTTDSLQGFTASDGRFIIGGIPIGAVSVSAVAAGYFEQTKSITVQPDEGGTNPALSFSLLSGETRITVTGVVLDLRTEAPLSAAVVSIADKPEFTTGDDGRFSVADVLVGDRTVKATLAGYDPYEDEVSIMPGMGDLRITLAKTSSEPPGDPYTVGGTVTLVGAADNSGAVVTALDLDSGVVMGTDTTDAEGSYGLFLPAGRYEITVKYGSKSISKTVRYKGGGRIMDGVDFTLSV